MERTLSLALIAAALAGPAVAAPLPAGVDPAELSRVLGEDLSRERLESLWDSHDFHFRVAAALSRAKTPAKAAWHLGEAVRLDPEFGKAHMALGKLFWRFGERDRAKDHWVKALECERPVPAALAVLKKLAPELAQEPVKVTDLDTFLEIARVSADLRRVGEVQQALASYAKGTGIPMVLTEGDWEEQLEKLATFRLLRRRGGLPSGEGMILTDVAGRAISSLHGSPANPRNLPEAMQRARGYRVAPEVLRQALTSQRPEAVELALRLLDDDQLEASWAALAASEELASWPSALDQLCFRLERRDAGAELPPPLVGLLRQLVADTEGVEPAHRWTARGHLHMAGARDLPPLPEGEIAPLLGQAFGRPTLMEACHSVLAPMGAAAEEPLLELVRAQQGSTALGSALGLLPRYGSARAVVPLVELIEMGRSKGYPPSSELKVIEALKGVTGADHGRDLGAWRAWASERGAAD